MNGKVYIQLPYEKYRVTKELISNIKSSLSNDLRPYFGVNLNVEFIDNAESQAAEVFVMDKPRYSESDDSVRKLIRDTLSLKIKGLEPLSIDVRINYSQLNP